MSTQYVLTIDVPLVIEWHKIGDQVQKLLDLEDPGQWIVRENSLIAEKIVRTAVRVRGALRTWERDEAVRVHAVIQTMRPVIDDGQSQTEILCPLLFVAAVDREGPIESLFDGDFTRIPDEVKETLVRTQRMFTAKKSDHKLQFNLAVQSLRRVVQSTGWFSPMLQRIWYANT